MPFSEIDLSSTDTPTVLVDLDIAARNIERFQRYADEHGIKVRPHVKTHKLPAIAVMQLEAGAVGITCQKVSEALAMVEGSPAIRDILITYNIVGPSKLAQLRLLADRVRLSVVADSREVIAGLSATFADAPRPLDVLVECNTGADRCGVATPEAAEDLASTIHDAPGLVFGGFMTYPLPGGEAAVEQFMTEAKARVDALGMAAQVISSGGTPAMMQAARAPVTTEYRPGTYVYNDRSLVLRGVCAWSDCALTVLATVVSVPAPNRAVIDAGTKILTSDLLGLEGFGHVLGRDDLVIDQLSEEHGRLASTGSIGLSVGDQVRIVPNHACVVSNMVDAVLVSGAGHSSPEVWRIAARGKLV